MEKWSGRVVAFGVVVVAGALVYEVVERHLGKPISAELDPVCYATNDGMTCTFTNIQEVPVRACTIGKVSQNGSGTQSIKSQFLCTGELGPRETRTVSARWLGRSPEDICFTESPFKGKELAWGLCSFSYEDR